eukprot:TRINITY_DN743_c0_g2_i1.p1 TRINITY_DN743_c0_g2~~TRINITY_DN743_c0_g2_i1.p1  ORF type:complete len:412 (+),score=60.81 TRINITY_DN743_c0_g2_i1:58-1293(+)
MISSALEDLAEEGLWNFEHNNGEPTNHDEEKYREVMLAFPSRDKDITLKNSTSVPERNATQTGPGERSSEEETGGKAAYSELQRKLAKMHWAQQELDEQISTFLRVLLSKRAHNSGPAKRRRRSKSGQSRSSLSKRAAPASGDNELSIQEVEIQNAIAQWVLGIENHKTVIKLCEQYKKSVHSSFPSISEFESIYCKLKELTGLDSISKKSPSKKSEKKLRGGSIKKHSSEPQEEETIWTCIDQYFIPTNLHTAAEFKRLLHFGSADELQTPHLLNLGAINRIAALAKMLQYCQETGTPLRKFREGRITQRIVAWHKVHNTENSDWCYNKITKGRSVDEEYFPLVEEMKYLINLDVSTISLEKEKLQASLIDNGDFKETEKLMSSIEVRLAEIAQKGSEVRSKVLKSMGEA